eukprot:COSAG01_NODE_10158_length_2233_cov_116.888472_2_plen_87_part_00
MTLRLGLRYALDRDAANVKMPTELRASPDPEPADDDATAAAAAAAAGTTTGVGGVAQVCAVIESLCIQLPRHGDSIIVLCVLGRVA